MNLSAIIIALGGRSTLQQLLDVGPSAISNYMTRGHLPNRAKPIIYAALIAKGYRVRADNLEILSAPSKSAVSDMINNSGPHIVLIISGGIAAYRALETVRQLQKRGARVTGVMTESAKQFVTPLSLAALTGQKCYDKLFSLTDEAQMGHIQLARSADLVLVAPATANFMARANAGIADDLATTILLATTAKVVMAPAMNPSMWTHPATKNNLASLVHRGIQMIGPDNGDTACGEEGEGRMCEPSYIADIAMKLVGDMPTIHPSENIANKKGKAGALVGKRIIITSGPTIEPIDKVRFIANRSSGKQGHAIATALANRGASVTLVSGPVNEAPPVHVNLIPVTTAAEMLNACTNAIASQPTDIAICAAAVSDWRVTSAASKKLKKPVDSSAKMLLELSQNPDILANLSTSENRPKLVIGFAAETENLFENATAKRHLKGCDWMIANQVGGDEDPIFGSTTNEALMITELNVETWPKMLKTELAEKIADRIEAEFSE